MPELPEVETVRRGLAPHVSGRTLAAVQLNRADLRFPFPENFAARLAGRTILGVRRRAKYLLFDLSGGETLIVHLGMSGRLTLEGAPRASAEGRYYGAPGNPAHTHVLLRFESGGVLSYNDPRRFGLMDLAETALLERHKLFAHLGIEPLGTDMSGRFLAEAFKGRAAPIKAALLDQTLVVGVGNIYASEALHRALISPRRKSGTIGPERAERLAAAIRSVLEEAIAAGGSTLRDYVQSDGALGYFQHSFSVYDRAGQACPRAACGGRLIKRIVQSNRSTYFLSELPTLNCVPRRHS